MLQLAWAVRSERAAVRPMALRARTETSKLAQVPRWYAYLAQKRDA
jgi:hypothetical protein